MGKSNKRPHPTFARANFGRTSRSRIKDNWRRPRGIDNKKAFKFKYMGCSPSIGYGQPSDVKYTHPQGKLEILAQTPSDLTGVKDVVIRIAGGVGAVKREAIQKLAESMKLKVVNPKKFVPRVAKPKVDAKGKPIQEAKPPVSSSASQTRIDAKKAPEQAKAPGQPQAKPPEQAAKAPEQKKAEPAKQTV